MPHTMIEDVRIHYEVAGEGPVLLLLHGMGSHGGQWQHRGYVDRFAPHFTVVTLDQRGHGESSYPEEVEAYTPARRMTDALAVLDALEVPEAHVFGYSMGGLNAIRLAMEHPERVKSLVLGGCNPYPHSINGRLVPPLHRRVWARIAHSRHDFIGKVRHRLFPGVERVIAARIRSASEPFEIDVVIERLRMPVLVFTAELDQAFNVELTRQFAEQLGDARFEVVAGEDHGVLDRPNRVIQVVEPFLLQQIA